MKSCFSFLTILFICSQGFTNNKVGNGGDGVFCKNSTIDTAELLDFYEEKIDFKTGETKPETIAEQRFEQLKKVAPKLGAQYLKRLKEIFAEIEYKDDVALTDIKDSNHLFKPNSEDCKVLQVVIRKAKALPNEKRFLFRNDLWKKLSSLHQAGLLTHEIIYEHFAKLGETDSIKARKMNRFIFQSSLKAEDFWNFMKDLEIPIYP